MPAIPGTTSFAIAGSVLAVLAVLFVVEADGPPMVEEAEESFALGAAGSVGFLRYARKGLSAAA
jgi:hypothetical protein